MDKENINYLIWLLYDADKNQMINELSNLDDPLMLHFFAGNYNWNDGFDVPETILENEHCDLGTGLLMFHLSDGILLLENPEEVLNSTLKEWKAYLLKNYYKLLDLDFKSQNISFDPRLTKIQVYNLKKNNSNIPDILINKSPGGLVKIPTL